MKKTVIVTGGSRGIGAAICRAFAASGYNVVINYNASEKEAEKLSALSGLPLKMTTVKEKEPKDPYG